MKPALAYTALFVGVICLFYTPIVVAVLAAGWIAMEVGKL